MDGSKQVKFDDKHGYIFHQPGVKAKSGQEAVTMFSGYTGIAEQFENGGECRTSVFMTL